MYQFLVGSYPAGFSKNQKRSLRRKCNNFEVKAGYLYHCKPGTCTDVWKQVPRRREDVKDSCHASVEGGHLGRDKTYTKIADRFFWKTIVNDVKSYVQHCEIC